MKVTEFISDFGFYVRAIESGIALMLMIGILTVRSRIKNESLFFL